MGFVDSEKYLCVVMEMVDNLANAEMERRHSTLIHAL